MGYFLLVIIHKIQINTKNTSPGSSSVNESIMPFLKITYLITWNNVQNISNICHCCNRAEISSHLLCWTHSTLGLRR